MRGEVDNLRDDVINSEGVKHSFLWYILMTFLVFCFTYQFDLQIFGFPNQLHSVRFAALMFYVLFGIETLKRTKKNDNNSNGIAFYKTIVNLHIGLFIYMLFLYFTIGLSEGEHMVVVLLNFFLFRLIPLYFCFKLFASIDELMHIVLWATLLQTVFIWISIINPTIGTAIDLVFNIDNLEYVEGHRTGYAGGIGCITAPGYIRYSIGQIACFYLFSKGRKVLYALVILILFITGTLIARTGLFAGAIVIVFMLYHYFSKKSIKAIVPLSIFSIILLLTVSNLFSNKNVSSFFEDRYGRMNKLFENSRDQGFLNNGFFDDYLHGQDNTLPPLSIETLIGIGVSSGTAGNGIKVNIDGGYLRVYAAYGLLLALFFYFFVFGKMYGLSRRTKNREVKLTLLLTLIMLIVAEYKEWTFYGTPYIWLFTLVAVLPSQEKLLVSDYRSE